MLDRLLAIFGGVADVLGGWPLDVRKARLEGGNDVAGLVQAERSLRQVRDPVRIGHGQRLHLFGRTHHLGHQGRLAQSSDDFIMIAVPDQDQRIAFLGKLHGFHMNLGDEWAGCVNHP